MRLYTVGHSSHTQEEFLRLLQENDVNCIVDVRSVPASKYAPQFNQDALESFLRHHGMTYYFFGHEFGARRMDSFNNNGQVDFELAVHTRLFQQGVERLTLLLSNHHVALMCSEANPLECHRFALIARYFHEQGIEVLHILKDASTVCHTTLEQEMVKQYLTARKPQLAEVDELFGTYTSEDQLRDAYRLKNKEIGYRVKQHEEYYG